MSARACKSPGYSSTAFGWRVRQLRVAERLTQTQLAECLSLSGPNAISRIERGTAKRISLELVALLCELASKHQLGVSWLFTDPPRGAGALP